MTDPRGRTPGSTDQQKDTKLTDKAQAAASAATHEVKTRAQDVADTVATEAGTYAGQAKDAAADEVKSVASALRTAADEMRSGSPQERTFSQIAESLADASDALRDRDLGEMVGAVSDFAKRNPMIFLGSAALIGFAATRFAKASRDGGTSRVGAYGQDAHRMARPAAAQRADISGAGAGYRPAATTTHEGNAI